MLFLINIVMHYLYIVNIFTLYMWNEIFTFYKNKWLFLFNKDALKLSCTFYDYILLILDTTYVVLVFSLIFNLSFIIISVSIIFLNNFLVVFMFSYKSIYLFINFYFSFSYFSTSLNLLWQLAEIKEGFILYINNFILGNNILWF